MNKILEENVTNNYNENLYKRNNNLNKSKKEMQEKESTKRRGNNIIIITLILILIGYANFYSTILRFDSLTVSNKLLKNFILIITAISGFLIASKINFNQYNDKKVRIFFLFAGIIIFLVVAFFPNKAIFPEINGGKGWIRISNFSLQITELFKIPYIIMISSIFARGKDDDEDFSYMKNFFSVCIYLGIFFVLLICLKDLGTAMHYILITFFLIFMTDIKDKILLIGGSCLTGGLFAVSYLFYKYGEKTGGYKYHRLKVFIEGVIENNYDRTEAYQIFQSLVGFGTGGILGKGYGNGVQKYNYIPEVETDFAISTFGEEMGLVGMTLILITFLILFILIMNVSENSKTFFGKYLASAIGGYFIIQVLINIGVSIGLIPILGIPLPFISSGGSSLLAISIGMGIVININNSHLREFKN